MTGEWWSRSNRAWPQDLTRAFGASMRLALRSGELTVDGKIPEPTEREAEPWIVPLGENWQDPGRWSLTWKGKWKTEEHINIQELRTCTLVARHCARDRRGWDRRHLIFMDSWVALGCLRRMRSRSWPLLRLLRRLGSLALAVGVRMIGRYCPTHLNWADGPSHGEGVGVAKQNLPGAVRRGGGPPV